MSDFTTDNDSYRYSTTEEQPACGWCVVAGRHPMTFTDERCPIHGTAARQATSTAGDIGRGGGDPGVGGEHGGGAGAEKTSCTYPRPNEFSDVNPRKKSMLEDAPNRTEREVCECGHMGMYHVEGGCGYPMCDCKGFKKSMVENGSNGTEEHSRSVFLGMQCCDWIPSEAVYTRCERGTRVWRFYDKMSTFVSQQSAPEEDYMPVRLWDGIWRWVPQFVETEKIPAKKAEPNRTWICRNCTAEVKLVRVVGEWQWRHLYRDYLYCASADGAVAEPKENADAKQSEPGAADGELESEIRVRGVCVEIFRGGRVRVTVE